MYVYGHIVIEGRDIHIGESLAIDGHVHIEGERHGHLWRLSMYVSGHIVI